MYVRGPHKNLGSFERSLRIFPYYIPMKYETTQLSQTISVGGCGTVKERSSPVIIHGYLSFWPESQVSGAPENISSVSAKGT